MNDLLSFEYNTKVASVRHSHDFKRSPFPFQSSQPSQPSQPTTAQKQISPSSPSIIGGAKSNSPLRMPFQEPSATVVTFKGLPQKAYCEFAVSGLNVSSNQDSVKEKKSQSRNEKGPDMNSSSSADSCLDGKGVPLDTLIASIPNRRPSPEIRSSSSLAMISESSGSSKHYIRRQLVSETDLRYRTNRNNDFIVEGSIRRSAVDCAVLSAGRG